MRFKLVMKILLGCLSFKNFTGSEIYFYELANGLLDLGHKVHLYSRFPGDPLISKCKDIVFETKDTICNQTFDKVIFSHGLVIWDDIKHVISDEFINVLHSEVLDLEKDRPNDDIFDWHEKSLSIYQDEEADLVPFNYSSWIMAHKK